ncbi:MAG TPA: hypothetical protein VNL36_00065 [Bacteroidota bacterium]|nr:hypothetical protein [Bacteroidota bacterium]
MSVIRFLVFRWGVALLIIQSLLLSSIQAQFRYLTIYANGDVRLLVIDPQGRRLGYDPSSNQYFEEIPRGNIGAAGIDIVTEEGGEADPSQVNPIEAMIGDATDGNYAITVFGQSLRFYYLSIRARHVSKPITNTGSWGIIDSGQTATFVFTYDFNDRTKSSIRREVTPGILLQDLDNCFKLGLIKNQGLYTSLKQKADNATSQHEKGQDRSAVNLLQAFLNEVKAQTGKGVDNDAAAILTEDAQALIQQWSK